jgi:Tol biopolymer transport system component
MQFLKKVSILSILLLFSGLAFAEYAMSQFFVFGKNRVQYEAFDWRFIETEHFDIYYYNEKNYHLAQFTAETVESSLRQLMEDFDHTLTDRIPVIIYDSHSDFSQTNVVDLPIDAQGIGGVTDKLKNRMTQPFMGDYADFRRTLQHELLHAVINDKYYGGSLQTMMRQNIQLRIPLWFEEGLAEYLALGWDTQTDMYIRDAIINNYLPPLYQLGGFFAYRGGQSFWNFIEEEYGRSKITEILQRLRQTRSVQQSLVQSTGLNLEELSNRWTDSLQRRYFPEVAERQRIDQVASRVTERGQFGSYSTSPSISPQGDRIAFISNRRAAGNVFDIVVVSAITGERLKTLIRGEDSPMFEELNILNPNLSWSPDGRKLALTTKADGKLNLGIIDYETEEVQLHRFANVDALASVAWSPDGTKIAFDGNYGGYQSIFVYDLENRELSNLTRDVFTDREPAWAPDSETIYFISNRGNKLRAGEFVSGYSALQDESFYQTDIYSIRMGSNRIHRLTNTPQWSESQPAITNDGQLVFISDQNGIPNIYEYNFDTRTSTPLTDIRTGINQLSISSDGSRIAFNALNDGYLDIYLMRNPFDRRMDRELTPNYWAERRASQSITDLVPATGYAMEMIRNRPYGNMVMVRPPAPEPVFAEISDIDEITDTEMEEEEEPEENGIDFRNYVFGEAVVSDTTIQLRDDPQKFMPEGNLTEEGYYQPKRYRLSFSPDITYAAGQIDTYYGGSAFVMVTLSDLFGDHRMSLGTNLVFDLRDSDYILQYGYFRQRTNFIANIFHQSRNYQTFFGELLRFRTYGAGFDFQYPFNRFERVDYGLSLIGISRDFSSIRGIGDADLSNELNTFLYPQVTYTADYTIPGFITPVGGSRYSMRVSGSPPALADSPRFVSVLGDYRRYLNLGSRYSIAVRGTGAASFGPDSQTFFMGGMLGWINQRWSDNDIPFERLADTFFTQPATPLRGHEFNTLYGDKFTLINAEFRFPLFAAVLPGPVPILPLYNITGLAFVDAGATWGFDINYSYFQDSVTGESIVYHQKSSDLDFKVAKREEVYLDPSTGLPRDGAPQQNDILATYLDGDILIGAGFGLRTILLGLPFRYDVGWAYDRDGFRSKPIHYFSIGIDF